MDGIIVNGKVYEQTKGFTCKECAFNSKCAKCGNPIALCADDIVYRYSPELTEKLNGKDNRD